MSGQSDGIQHGPQQNVETRKSNVDRHATTVSIPPPLPGNNSFPRPFGRYTLLRKLGAGAMGDVFLAKDTKLDGQVALKIPRISDAQSRDRFLREARAGFGLHHSGICPVYDAGEYEGKLYISMAYIAGRPLSSLKFPAPPVKAARIVYQIAQAVDYLNQEGIVHRDLKPANVMLDEKDRPIVMDFGLARRGSSNDPSLTASGAIMGTPYYMSPEQADGLTEQVGPASDVYSLGVILYEMLTGTVPFRGQLREVLNRIVTEEPKRASKHNPKVDPRLEGICLKAMSKQIENRYASMGDFASDLLAYLKEARSASSGVAPPPLPAEQSNTPSRKSRWKRRLVLWSFLVGTVWLAGFTEWGRESTVEGFSQAIAYLKSQLNRPEPSANQNVSPDQNDTESGPGEFKPDRATPNSDPEPKPVVLNFKPIADQKVNEGEELALRIELEGQLPQNESVRYELDWSSPAGCEIDASSGQIRWIPDENLGGSTATIKVVGRLRDATAPEASCSFSVSVLDVNQPPKIAPVTSVKLDYPDMLQFEVEANDTDLPRQFLTFELGESAPEGAAINPKTGLLTWSPRQGDKPGSYSFPVRVFDSGEPRQMAARTVIVEYAIPYKPAFETNFAAVKQGELPAGWIDPQGAFYKRTDSGIHYLTVKRDGTHVIKLPERVAPLLGRDFTMEVKFSIPGGYWKENTFSVVFETSEGLVAVGARISASKIYVMDHPSPDNLNWPDFASRNRLEFSTLRMRREGDFFKVFLLNIKTGKEILFDSLPVRARARFSGLGIALTGSGTTGRRDESATLGSIRITHPEKQD